MNANPAFIGGLRLGLTDAVVNVDPATGLLMIQSIMADGALAIRISLPQAAPVVSTAVLVDQIYVQNSGVKSFDVSVGFVGTGLSYALSPALAGVSINATTGIVTTTTTAQFAETQVTVRASNTGGFVERSLRFSVGAAPSLSGTAIPDQLKLTQGTVPVIIAAAPAFSGTVTAWSISGAGVSIHPTTGVITIARASAQGLQTVTVRAANSYGFAETSFQTSVVAAGVTLISPGTITGTVTVGSVLAVIGDSFTGEDITATWAWTRDGVDIVGAVNPTYLLKAADVGKTVARRIRVSGTGGSATGATPGVTVGVVESAVTFNPLQMGAGVILSNAGRSAAVNGNFTVRAAKPFLRTSPKFYAEIVVPAGAHSLAHVGVSGYDTPNYTPNIAAVNEFSTFAGLDRRVIDPLLYGANRALLLNNTVGGIYRIAVDPSAGKIYFGTAAGWASGTGTAVAFGSAYGFPMPALEEMFITIAPRSTNGDKIFTLRSCYGEFTNYSGDAALIAAGYISYGELNSYQASPAIRAADTVVDRLGVNYDIGSLPVAFRTTAHDRVGELGVRTIRAALGGQSAANTAYDWFVNPEYGLNSRFGTKIIALAATKSSSPAMPTFNNVAAAINLLKTVGQDKIRAIEGANEADYKADPQWQSRTLDAQAQIYNGVNAVGSSIAGVPVIGFTVWERSLEAEASVRAILSGGNLVSGGGAYGQMANAVGLHYYNSQRKAKNGSVGQADGDGFDNVRMETTIASARLQGGGGSVPIYVTEFGYKAGQFQYAPNKSNATPEVAAKNMAKAYLSLLACGVEMAVIYCLYDSINLLAANDAREFGLLAWDDADPDRIPPKEIRKNVTGQALRTVDGTYSDLKRRAAFYTIKALISIFDEKGAVPTSLTGLSYGLSGDLSDIGHMLFKKTDDTFLLAIWNDAQIWKEDTTAFGENTIAERPIKLGLTKVASSVRRKLLPLTAIDTAWTDIGTNVQELILSVSGEIAVYQITL